MPDEIDLNELLAAEPALDRANDRVGQLQDDPDFLGFVPERAEVIADILGGLAPQESLQVFGVDTSTEDGKSHTDNLTQTTLFVCDQNHVHQLVRTLDGQVVSNQVVGNADDFPDLKAICRDERGRFASCGGTGRSPVAHAERAKERVEKARKLVQDMKDGPKPPHAVKVKELADHLGTMTVAELHALKKEHNLSASGATKAALKDRLVTRYVEQMHKEAGANNPLHERPKEWVSGNEGEAWGKKTYQSWAQALTAAEKGAVEKYKSHDDAAINKNWGKHLREGGTVGNAPGQHAETMTHLDTALAAGQTNRDVITYRGIHGEAARRVVDGVGGHFTDKGYQSTSVRKTLAEDFATDFGEGKVHATVLAIHIPKGSRGAYVDTLPSTYSSEGEFLLPRNSRLHILSAHHDGEVWRVQARLAQ